MMLVITLFLFGVAFLSIGVRIFKTKDSFPTELLMIIVGLGFLVIATFISAPEEIPIGLPSRSIGVGEHKVAFVYIAGKNVNLGIEKTWGSDDKDSYERL